VTGGAAKWNFAAASATAVAPGYIVNSADAIRGAMIDSTTPRRDGKQLGRVFGIARSG